MHNKLDLLIEQLTQEILTEASVENVIDLSGALGSGAWSKEIKSVKSRAVEDPQGLLKDLKIKIPTGDSFFDQSVDVIRQARKNSVMNEAFGDVVIQRIINDKNKEMLRASVEIKAKSLSYRNATKYIALTLLASINAGILQPDNEKIVFTKIKDTSGIPSFVVVSK